MAKAKPDPFRDDILDRLADLPGLRSRAMFGGHGLYAGPTFFGLLAAGRVYLRVDDATRPKYEAAGMGPFRPFPDKGPMVMRNYYEVPAEVVDDPDEFPRWATEAVAAGG